MRKKFIGCLVVVFLCLVLVGCSKNNKKNSIIGKWKNDSFGYDFVYTFNEDGTGKYDAAGTIMKFTYTLKGNKLSIKYTGDNMASFDTKYSVDGDTLNVVDSLGEDTLYKKVK